MKKGPHQRGPFFVAQPGAAAAVYVTETMADEMHARQRPGVARIHRFAMALWHHLAMIRPGPTPPTLTAALHRELAGELVRWSGQPGARAAFRATMPIWIMGIPWSALMFPMFGFMLASACVGKPAGRMASQADVIAMVAALVFVSFFVLIGLGMLLAPFWAARQARHTLHVVTDKRVITIIAGRATTVRSVLPHQITTLQRKELPDGSGTLSIGVGREKDSEGTISQMTEVLLGVPHVANAERFVRALQIQGLAEST